MFDELNLADDPQLTAYALGELSPEEAARIERQLADSLTAQAAVREIRELAGILQAGLQSEPAPALREQQRAAILGAAARAPASTGRRPNSQSGRSHSATSAQPANSATGVENPGDRREAASAPRRRWTGRLASMTTVVAVLMVGVLLVSTTDTRKGIPRPQRKDVLSGQAWVDLAFPLDESITGSPDMFPALRSSDEFFKRRAEPLTEARVHGAGSVAVTAQARPRYLVDSSAGYRVEKSVAITGLELKPNNPVVNLAFPAKAPSQMFPGLARADEPMQHDLRVRRQIEELGRPQNEAPGTEAYAPIAENQFVTPQSAPLSTFGVDVDTASYSNVRRFLTGGRLPPPDAVRVEELVNYFRYETPAAPVDGRPFTVAVEVGAAPWQPAHRLVRIELKGREIAASNRPASNLVFLVDVSGSMQSDNKLPLAKAGLRLLAGQMTESDTIAIVTYSDTAMLRLAATNGTNQKAIVETIDGLQAGGSTNGAGGIQLAYRAAIENFIDGGVNRVILCTDGDFNVGVTGDDELVQLIEERARTKIFFSVFGFGMGNLKDGKLEKLADKGNGHYAYIDGSREAKKVFVDELAGTLVTIAKDVKVQVEFNPARVAAYRLIGYENRALAAHDFDDDGKDAGDIGAGHSVTALYEVVPAPDAPAAAAADGLRYEHAKGAAAGPVANELLAVKLRYKEPQADNSLLVEVPVADMPSLAAQPAGEPASARRRLSRDFEWSAAVAAFGMVLRHSAYRGQAGLDLVLELAQGARGDDLSGRRREFIELVERAKALRPDLASATATTPPSPGAAPPGSANQNKREAFKNLSAQQIEELLGGRYKNLLRIIPAEADAAQNGNFRDDGYRDTTTYLGHDNLPKGYWVYVYPNWYIWGDAAEQTPPAPAKPR